MNNITFKTALVMFIFFVGNKCFSQGVSINVTGDTAHASASLDITSDHKGILIPRMTMAERLAIVNAAEGLLVYQYDSTKGFYYFRDTVWVGIENRNPHITYTYAEFSESYVDTAISLPQYTTGWNSRNLNNTNYATSTEINRDSNKITLQRGVYKIFATAFPACGGIISMLRVYDSTHHAELLRGNTTILPGMPSWPIVVGILNIEAQTTILLQQLSLCQFDRACCVSSGRLVEPMSFISAIFSIEKL